MIQRSPHRKKDNLAKDHDPIRDEPQMFGDIVTADHKSILNKAFTSFDKDTRVLLCKIVMHSILKGSIRTAAGMNLFIGPEDNINLM